MSSLRHKYLTAIGVSVALITAAGCGSSSSGSTPAAQQSGSTGAIKFADIQPLTGASGQYGQQAVQGAQIAVDNLNGAGGVLGKMLSLTVADDASNATQSTTLMKKYGSDKSISAVIGPTYTADFAADAPFAQKFGVVIISSGSTAPWQGSFNDWTFRSSVPGQDYLPELVTAITKAASVKTAAQVWAIDNEALAKQGKSLDGIFAQKGIKVLTDQQATNDTTDFHPQVTAIMQNPPDVVAIGLITNGAELFTEQLRAAGYKGLLMASGSTLLDPSLYKGSNGAANGLIVPTSFDANSTSPVVKAFVSAFQQKYHTVPNAQQAFGYDAVLLLANAIKTAGSTDRGKIRAALGSTSGFEGAQGEFTFHNSGDNTTPTVHVLQLTEAGFVPYPAGKAQQ